MIGKKEPDSNAWMVITAGIAVLLLASGMGVSHLFAQSKAARVEPGVDRKNPTSTPTRAVGDQLPGLAWGSAVDQPCQENCSVEVENQFEETDIEVYVCPTKDCNYYGDVSAMKSKAFDLPEGEWEHVQLHIREAPTHRFINLRCVREFEDGTARAVIRPEQSLERCSS